MEPDKALIQLIKRIEQEDFEKVNILLSEDFRFSGYLPGSFGKQEYIELYRNMLNAFSDFSFNLGHVEKLDMHSATGIIQLTGRHTGTLDFRKVKVGIRDATDKTFTLPREDCIINVEGEKITSLEIHTSENGGLNGILNQLGVGAHLEQ